MSSDETSPEVFFSHALPPLTDGACAHFINLLHNYCIVLSKGQDSDDFHLDTVRLSAAVDVCPFLCEILSYWLQTLFFLRSGAQRTIRSLGIWNVISLSTAILATWSTLLRWHSGIQGIWDSSSLMYYRRIPNEGQGSFTISSWESRLRSIWQGHGHKTSSRGWWKPLAL